MLSAKQLSIIVNKKTLLKNIDLDIKPGEVTILLGCNGSGKSTLLHALSGDFSQNHHSNGVKLSQLGCCELDSQILSNYQPPELARRRAVMAQRIDRVFKYDAREFVKLGRYPYQNKSSVTSFKLKPQLTLSKFQTDENDIVNKALELADATCLANRDITTLSGGEFARIQFARALAQLWIDTPIHSYPKNKAAKNLLNASYLLLDEPTAALDLNQQHRLLATSQMLSRKWGIGVFTIVHDINLAICYADNLAWLKAGELIAAGPAQDNFNAKLISEVLGYSVDIILREDLTPVAIPNKWVWP